MAIVGWIMLGILGLSVFLSPAYIVSDLKPREARGVGTVIVARGFDLVVTLIMIVILWANLHGRVF